GATDGTADANGDGLADGADFAQLQSQLGRTADAGNSSIDIGVAIDVEVGGSAALRSTAGGEIRVGVAANGVDSGRTVELGRLTFETSGDVQVIEDSSQGLLLGVADFDGSAAPGANLGSHVLLEATGGEVLLSPLIADSLTVRAAEQITALDVNQTGGISVANDATFAAGLGAGRFLAADFDSNGVVDAADLAVWRANFGATDGTADANGDGLADGADYAFWQNAISSSRGVHLSTPLGLSVGGTAVFTDAAGGDISVGRASFTPALLNEFQFDTAGAVNMTLVTALPAVVRLTTSPGIPVNRAAAADLQVLGGAALRLDSLAVGSLSVVAAGGITDATRAQIHVAGRAALSTAPDFNTPVGAPLGITLADNAGDRFTAGSLDATTADTPDGVIEIGLGGDAEIGLIENLLGDAARISDNTDTVLQAADVRLLELTSGGAITGTGVVAVAEDAAFTTTGAGGEIELDQLAVGGEVRLATADGDAAITNDGVVTLGPTGVAGNLAVTANTSPASPEPTAGIRDTGTVSVAGMAEFRTTGLTADIMLDQLAVVGMIGLTAPTSGLVSPIGNATIVNATGIDFKTTSVGSLTATATTGGITNTGGPVSVDRAAALTAAAGDIDLGGANAFAAETISLSGGDVAYTAGATPTLQAIDAQTLAISSAEDIVDAGDAQIRVAGDATFTTAGGSIRLATSNSSMLEVGGLATFDAGVVGRGDIVVGNSFDTANFGSLSLIGGAANVNEASSTMLVDVDVTSLQLSSGGSIGDSSTLVISGNAGFSAANELVLNETGGATPDLLTVGGTASFTAASISVGGGGTFTAGSILFTAPGTVFIQEDDATTLLGSRAGTLTLISSGAITDGPTATSAADTRVTGDAAFTAGGDITLADAGGESLTVGGQAAFLANDGGPFDVRVGVLPPLGTGPPGQARFGSLLIEADEAFIAEADATRLDAATARRMTLSAAGSITDTTGTAIRIAEDLSLKADAGGSIFLAGSAADTLDVGGLAELTAGGAIAVGPAGLATFGQLSLAGTEVEVQEDDGTLLVGVAARSLELVSAGDITDAAGADIRVAQSAEFRAAAGAITLNDTGDLNNPADPSADVLVVGGQASFTSGNGVAVGAGGRAEFGSLAIDTTDASIQEDDSTLIDAVTAQTLRLDSRGAITDAPHASILVAGDAEFIADTRIELNDTAVNPLTSRPADLLDVGGKVSFTVDPAAADGSIDVGPAGVFTAGSLRFNAAGDVRIQEDASGTANGTVVAMTNTAGTVVLDSAGPIDVAGSITAAELVKLISAGGITLGADIAAGTPGGAAGQVGLFAQNAITQTGGGILTQAAGGELLVSIAGGGDAVLTSATNVTPRLAASINDGSLDAFTSGPLQVANLTIAGMNVAGVQIVDTGAADSHTLRLEAGNGDISQETQAVSDARIDADVQAATFVVADGRAILIDDLGVTPNATNYAATNNRLFNDNAGSPTPEADLVFATPDGGQRVGDLTVLEQTAVLLDGVDIQGELIVAAGRSPRPVGPYTGGLAIVDASAVVVDGPARLHAFGAGPGPLAIDVDQLAVAGVD
ncbi:MAG: hypothetical protein AAF790_11290, partial [Planctomycetota bacterium]